MSNLSYFDRRIIEKWYGLKRVSLRNIAKLIGRDVSVVSREIARHKPQFGPYNADLAQAAARRKAGITNKRKLDKCPELQSYVKARLLEDWSPEQIAGRLKEHPPPGLKDAKVKRLSTEPIYQYVYQANSEGGENRTLYKHLRCRRPKRQKWGQRKHRQVQIPEKVSIHRRPELINNKKRYGDFEIDMLEGKKGKGAVSNHYERKMMLVVLHKLNGKKAEETTEATKKTCEGLPPRFIRSITYDNGGENAGHREIRDEYELKTYFCDPFKAWQKGGVENANGLIRQYIPKGTDMENIDQKYLNFVQNRLNNRPRKSLDYLTPSEVLDRVINTKCCIKL
jgi:IS30 family transposase